MKTLTLEQLGKVAGGAGDNYDFRSFITLAQLEAAPRVDGLIEAVKHYKKRGFSPDDRLAMVLQSRAANTFNYHIEIGVCKQFLEKYWNLV